MHGFCCDRFRAIGSGRSVQGDRFNQKTTFLIGNGGGIRGGLVTA
ncbi:hypothetical protein [Egbenema bharatensis]